MGPVDVFHGLDYLLPAQRAKAAMVVTVHALSAVRHPEWHPQRRALMHRVALSRTIRAVRHVITDTEAIRAEVIADLDAPPERVTSIHPAGSPGFRPMTPDETRPNLSRRGLTVGDYLLFAGALKPRKNLIRLVEAVVALQDRHGEVPPLVLAGPPGWRNHEIHRRILIAGRRVRYLGHMPKDDLTVLTAGRAAFIMPSLYEGFGFPVLDAMASGVAVITSRGGALEGVAADAAFLVDSHDPASIAAGIEAVLDDTALRGTLLRKGLARAGQFTWERTARQTLAVYEPALAP